MPGCVLDESMEPSKVMPGNSVIVEEEEALVRPKEPTLHTCWTEAVRMEKGRPLQETINSLSPASPALNAVR